ncbi:hypothetical protein TNCV_2288461 [Trichonephila clavipes]|nr:hypothetical protein TNCV_2288461 [Trichonephila clavipes]
MFSKRVYKLIRYQTDKFAVCVGGTETTRNSTGMHYRKCHSYQLRVNEAEKSDKNRNTVNGEENSLLNGHTNTGVRNYDQKSSGRPNEDSAWNSIRS